MVVESKKFYFIIGIGKNVVSPAIIFGCIFPVGRAQGGRGLKSSDPRQRPIPTRDGNGPR